MYYYTALKIQTTTGKSWSLKGLFTTTHKHTVCTKVHQRSCQAETVTGLLFDVCNKYKFWDEDVNRPSKCDEAPRRHVIPKERKERNLDHCYLAGVLVFFILMKRPPTLGRLSAKFLRHLYMIFRLKHRRALFSLYL